MGTWLSVGGVLLQLVGALVALRGLVKTHDAYAEKSIRTLVAERLAEFRTWIVRSVRRLLRRPEHRVIYAESANGLGMTGNVIATVTWGPLPAPVADAIRELDRRVRDLSKRADGLDQRMTQVANDERAALDRLRADLEKTGHEASRLIRNAAIEGLIGEAIGLVLVIVGGILQAWGTLIPSG